MIYMKNTVNDSEIKGLKFDTDKLRWDLLPMEVIEECVKILTFGAKKYDDNRIVLGRKNNPDQPGIIFVPYLRHNR